MKTRYKFIHFAYDRTWEEWKCFSNENAEKLGDVHQWKDEYTFHPCNEYTYTDFNVQNLRDIADFLEQLNKEKK